ncbi:MAG: hypothetical protein FDX18_06300 [Chlorobium sp.]|nr:MAG: hypothetical protein FDX18_06300 [Chlorobium sp.]
MTTIAQMLPIDFSVIGSQHIALAITLFSVALVALLMLSLIFSLLPKLFNRNLRKKFQKEGMEGDADYATNMVPGEVSAAIAMAIALYLEELHDREIAILTIKKVGKTYSPWNSKIYNVIKF